MRTARATSVDYDSENVARRDTRTLHCCARLSQPEHCERGISALVTSSHHVAPLVADRSPAAIRARIVGWVMPGVLLGVLLARILSGTVAPLWGPVASTSLLPPGSLC